MGKSVPALARRAGKNATAVGMQRASVFAEAIHMNTSKLLVSAILGAAIGLGASQASAMCGDVTGDGRVSATDALSVLEAAIGGHDEMMCEPCDGTTTTLDPSTTTTTVVGGASSYTLHVDKQGMHSGGYMNMNGNGRVTSEPVGINCGNDCVGLFDAGLDVTLTAVPNASSYFIGWSGDVPSECYYSDDPCTVTMTHDLDVHARFMSDDYGMPHR